MAKSHESLLMKPNKNGGILVKKLLVPVGKLQKFLSY